MFDPSKDEKHYKTNIIVHSMWQIKNLKIYIKKDRVTEAARLLLPRKNNSVWQS
jgi:hypothetical protein